jgi:CheY-like chemotaxis protein
MILIVDDFADGATALCKLLTKMGYPCQWVTGGREALAAIRAHPRELPLLVVLDQMMPDLNGIDVVRALRDDPATRDTNVIMFTAGFDVAKREEALTLGVLSWILKGQADMPTTLSTITDWYERIGGAKTTSAPNRSA